MTAEQKTRVSIDVLLVQASWHVCNVPNANVDASNGVVTARIRPIKAIRSRFIAIALMCDDVMRWAIRRGKTRRAKRIGHLSSAALCPLLCHRLQSKSSSSPKLTATCPSFAKSRQRSIPTSSARKFSGK